MIDNDQIQQFADDVLSLTSDDVLNGWMDDAVASGERLNSGIHLISTGYQGAGEVVPITFPRKALTLFAAKTGGGKTTCLLNVAVGLASRGYNGLFITLEEPAFKLGAKAMAVFDSLKRDNGLTVREIETLLRRRNIDEWKSVEDYKIHIAPNLKFIDANSDVKSKKSAQPSILYDAEYLDWFASRYEEKLDFIIVDYIQLMTSEESGNDGYARMKAVMQSVRYMTGQHNAAIIMGAQLNRQVIGLDFEEWVAEHLREAADIEQGANQIFACCAMTREGSPTRLGIRCLKNRDDNPLIEGFFNINFSKQFIEQSAINIIGEY